ncbi:MAG: hypothetical protein Q9221_006612 [Calogaya cf. arnoldii]
MVSLIHSAVTCAIGLTSTMVYRVALLLVIEMGGDRHLWNVPVNSLVTVLSQVTYIINWDFGVANTFIKLTFFILYWNIFKPFRWLKFAIIIGGVVVIGLYIAATLTQVIGAAPRFGRSQLDHSSLVCGICQKVGRSQAIFAVVSNVYILVLSIAGTLRLQLHPKKKFGLILVFMTGSGQVSLTTPEEISWLTSMILVDNSTDITYTAMPLLISFVVELCVGICIACVPTTSLFLRYILPSTDRLETRLQSGLEKLGKRLPELRSGASRRNESYKSQVGDVTGPYQSLRYPGPRGKGRDEYELALYAEQGITTEVSSEPSGNVREGVIHMKVELEQHESANSDFH